MTQRNRIIFFLNEWLTYINLKPVIQTLNESSTIEIEVISDGYNDQVSSDLGAGSITLKSTTRQNFIRTIHGSDLIVMGKTFDQNSELNLIAAASACAIPLAVFLPDLGEEPVFAKVDHLLKSNALASVDVLVSNSVASAQVSDALRDADVGSILVVGSPWIDDCERNRTRGEVQGIVYFDCPFEFDRKRGIYGLPAYPQERYVREVCGAIRRAAGDLRMYVKMHSQSAWRSFGDFCDCRWEILDVSSHVGRSVGGRYIAVSSYSSSLLDASIAGNSSFSYQPWRPSIRRSIFCGLIPITRTVGELEEQLASVQSRTYGARIRSNIGIPARSTEAIIDYIKLKLLVR